jgi:dihydrofolate synthase/folylpolyglutamate synthase
VGETHLGTDGAWSRVQIQTRIWGALEVRTPLAGKHQLENTTLAVKSLEGLPPRLLPTRAGIIEGCASVRIPGRLDLQERSGGGVLLLDVAHNADGVGALCETLERSSLPRPWIGVVGILADKAVVPMVARLAAVLDHLILTLPPGAPPARLWDPESVAEMVQRGTLEGARSRAIVQTIPALAEAYATGDKHAGPEGTLLVTGSFYTVGEVYRMLHA